MDGEPQPVNGQNGTVPNTSTDINPSITHDDPESIDKQNPQTNKYSAINGHQLRSSTRVPNKRLDLSIPVTNDRRASQKPASVAQKETQATENRNWTPEEINCFFEALKECGRDFDAMHKYFVNKYKKKGMKKCSLKTRSQIRHFYQRSWLKVSKYVTFSDELKKNVQECYGLINYGVLRQKFRWKTDIKLSVALNELIYHGSVLVRLGRKHKKNLRIKTPTCRALLEINNLGVHPKFIGLPSKITVQLQPRDMRSWMYVQSQSQNPRIQCVMTLEQRLSTLLTTLNTRWQSNKTDEAVKNDITDILTHYFKRTNAPMRLRVAPVEDATINIPKIAQMPASANGCVALNAYEDRMNIKTRSETLWNDMLKKREENRACGDKTIMAMNYKINQIRNRKISDATRTKRARSNSDAAHVDKIPGANGTDEINWDNEPNGDDKEPLENNVQNAAENPAADDNSNQEPGRKRKKVLIDEPNAKLEQTDARKKVKRDDDAEDLTKKTATKKRNKSKCDKTPCVNASNLDGDESDDDMDDDNAYKQLVDSVKSGWDESLAESVSIGELYLMVGANGNIPLRYWFEFDDVKVDATKVEVQDVPGKIDEIIAVVHDNKEEKDVTDVNVDVKLENSNGVVDPNGNSSRKFTSQTSFDAYMTTTGTLKHLLSFAKLYYGKKKLECPCGHVCRGVKKQDAKKLNGVKKFTNGATPLSFENGAKQTFDGVFRRPLPIVRHPSTSIDNTQVVEAFQAQIKSFNCRRSDQYVIHGMGSRHHKPLANRPKSNSVQTSQPLQVAKPDATRKPAQIKLKCNATSSKESPTATSSKESSTGSDNTFSNIGELIKGFNEKTHDNSNINVTVVNNNVVNLDVNTFEPITPAGLTIDNNNDSNFSIACDLMKTPEYVREERTLQTPDAKFLVTGGGSRAASPSILEILDLGWTKERDDDGDTINDASNISVSDLLGMRTPSLAASPTHLLKESGDSQWLNNVADLSFSSFLGHLDSSAKPNNDTDVPDSVDGSEDARMETDNYDGFYFKTGLQIASRW